MTIRFQAVKLPTATLILTLCMRAFALSNEHGPKVGDRPPAFELEKLLQAPPGAEASWEKLRGKVVVLEFWATWCAPCRAAIPHLNELAEQFKDKPVQFIAVTAENERVVKEFLQRFPIKAWVGIDAFKAMNRAYGIVGIPHSVIVDTNGVIAAIMYPMNLKAEHLNDILAGKATDLPQLQPFRPEAEAEVEEVVAADKPTVEAPLFQVLIRPAKAKTDRHGVSCSWSHTTNWTEIKGEFATVESALLFVYDTTPVRVIQRTDLPKGSYDFLLNLPVGRKEFAEAAFGQALQATFGLRVTPVTQEMDSYRLTVVTNGAPGLRPVSTGGGGHGAFGGSIEYKGQPISSLVEQLEPVLARPVFDETGLTGLYGIYLKWEMSDAESLPFRFDGKARVAILDEWTPGQERQLKPEQRKLIRAIRGELTGAEFGELPAKTQADIRLVRAELAKPEIERFKADPLAVIKAVREQLGLELTAVKRPVELLVIESVRSEPQHTLP